MPIVFDMQTSEYQFKYEAGTLIIYHCPFCGGAAPESKRSMLFAVIPAEEEHGLAQLLTPLQKISDALEQLGKPEQDNPSGTTSGQECPSGQPHLSIELR